MKTPSTIVVYNCISIGNVIPRRRLVELDLVFLGLECMISFKKIKNESDRKFRLKFKFSKPKNTSVFA